MTNKEDGEDIFYNLSRRWALVAVGASLPAFFIFALAGHPDKGLVAFFSIGIMLLILRICWRLRTKIWFWCIFALILSIHAVAVLYANFGVLKYTFVVCLPVVMADFFSTFAIFWFSEKWFRIRNN
jgi:hypothetical protein